MFICFTQTFSSSSTLSIAPSLIIDHSSDTDVYRSLVSVPIPNLLTFLQVKLQAAESNQNSFLVTILLKINSDFLQ